VKGSSLLLFACLICGCSKAVAPKQDVASNSVVANEDIPGETSGKSVGGTVKEVTNSVGMKLVLIPKGTFTMGSPVEEVGSNNDEQQHQVTVSKDYYLGVTEVTQGQYEKVMGVNPSYFQKRVIRKSDSSMYPVEQVWWENAVEFCKRLSELPEEKKAGRVYRLPTEAEWEYACRAGSKTAFYFGDDSELIGAYAWHPANSGDQTHPVGEKKPNAWGLYDMHGNVWEWCSDWYGDYPEGAVTDPVGPEEGSYRVYRGGSWCYELAYCRSASRFWWDPSIRVSGLNGFRVSLSSSRIPE
jgi:formylglycine-generating enzyme required for sulfatase activity